MNDNKIKEQGAYFTIPARTAAQYSGMVLFGGLVVFCLGYSVGYHQALQESLRGIQKESLAQEIYANAFFVDDKNQGVNTSETSERTDTDTNEISELVQEGDQSYFTARLIGYPETHRRSAVQFVEKWKKRGITLIIKEHASGKNKKKRWIQVLLEPHADRMQIELLADIISKEEKLSNVIAELYSAEEKTI